MPKKLILLMMSILIMGVLLIPSCRVGSSPLAESVTIRVSATQDFGKQLIYDREALIDKRMNAQDVLARVTDIQIEGSYVVEFEGLRGNDHDYWMYYINGLLSKVFASGYLMRPGDVMHWDFHPWVGSFHGSSAIIGSFPEPLIHGYEGQVKPTVVVYSPEFSAEAATLVSGLKKLGVTQVSFKEESVLSTQEKGNSNVILIADAGSPLVGELNEHYQTLGLYSHFTDKQLVVTDYQFASKQQYGAGAGVIQACQNLWNPLGTGTCQNAIFMVSGTDADGVKAAAQAFTKSMEDILEGRTPALDNAFGVIVTGQGEIIKTPL